MHAVDWAILFAYLVLTLVIGLLLRRRASGSPQDFFISGRKLPWWILGTSMAATSFAADTPLAITGLTAAHGISGNWLWWTILLANVTSAVVFAPLWRRARILTDLEFIELRYGGPEARYLRGFLAVYRGVVINCLIMGWVFLALGKIAKVFLGLEPVVSLSLGLALVLIYATLSGLWGVVVTDLIQFATALTGSVALAFLALRRVGGIDGLVGALHDRFGADGAAAILSPFPADGGAFTTIAWSSLGIYLLVLWWNRPEVEGTGYIAQRMMAARSEKDALWGTAWFVFLTYAVRTWPWIVTALAAMVLFPDLADPETGYPEMMRAVLPVGLLGLLVTSMVAAFMSTIDTHLNWGTSYLVHDLYRRFVRPVAPERHYVRVAKVAELGLGVIALLVALRIESIAEVWKILFSITAGLGFVHVMRWIWWRINVYTEITVMAASLLSTVALRRFTDLPFPQEFAIACAVSIGAALAATFLTRPTPVEVRRRFLERLRPPAIFWGEMGGGAVAWGVLGRIALRWSLTVAANLLCLLAPAYLLLGRPVFFAILLGTGIVLFIVLVRSMRRDPVLT